MDAPPSPESVSFACDAVARSDDKLDLFGEPAALSLPRPPEPSVGDVRGWHLTWPIWHMLPREERKSIAARAGFGSIGEFEENMSLLRAVDVSYGRGGLAAPSRPTAATETVKRTREGPRDAAEAARRGTALEDDDEEPEEAAAEESAEAVRGDRGPGVGGGRDGSDGGLVCAALPTEVRDGVFSYLDVDMFCVAARVHREWTAAAGSERICRALCERTYGKQSRRGIVNVERFGGSYKRMLSFRPRVRTGGIYALKYSHIKPIQRDMWCEIPHGVILETVYFRYFVFREDGTVFYACTTALPHEMAPRFVRMAMDPHHVDRCAVAGRYDVTRKGEVHVWARHSWTDVSFEMQMLRPGVVGGGMATVGPFCAMEFTRHRACMSGQWDGSRNDIVKFKVPSEPFIFLRDWRL